MRKLIPTYFLIAMGTLVFTMIAGGDVNAETSGAQVTTLLKTDIGGMEGKKWHVMTVEVAPGTAGARKLHPGAEVIYVLEGTGFLEVDGKPPVTLSPGTVTALGLKQSHVVKSTSQTQTLRVLIVLHLEKGHAGLPSRNGAPSPKAVGESDATRVGLVF